ncbi:MAG: hypothetical protein QF879_03775 [Candidatus Latescibacteria bacterium]|nr:hypothetical protein [Candidatus Latescibacterota bacterium]
MMRPGRCCRRYETSISIICLTFIFWHQNAEPSHGSAGFFPLDSAQTSSGMNESDDDRDTRSIVTRLNEKYGRQWSFKILSHDIDENVAVVLGEITASGVTKQQFGTATLHHAEGEALKAATSTAFIKTAALFGIHTAKRQVDTSPIRESVPVPSSAPLKGPPAAPLETEQVVISLEQQVTNTVIAWSQAWSQQDADTYLSFYAPEFQTPSKVPRRDWETVRRQRLTKPGFIEVMVSDLKVLPINSTMVYVWFTQSFRSDTLQSVADKEFKLKQKNDRWEITMERVIR